MPDDVTEAMDRSHFEGTGGRGRVGGGPGQGGKLTAGIVVVFDVVCRGGCRCVCCEELKSCRLYGYS
jgi:hypothetical protein